MHPAITRRIDLYERFLATWPEIDPKLAEDALRCLREDDVQRRRPPRVDNEAQAIWWLWTEDISLDGPEVAIYLQGWLGAAAPGSIVVDLDGVERRVAGAPDTISRERLMLETRARRVLAAIADKVRRRELVFTATHPKTHEPFRPDPALLEKISGSDRSRNQITTSNGVITGLGFHEPDEKPAAPTTEDGQATKNSMTLNRSPDDPEPTDDKKPPSRPSDASRPRDATVKAAVKEVGNLGEIKLLAAVRTKHPGVRRQQVRDASHELFGSRPAHRPSKDRAE
jgi:hypothetical protein